MSSASPPITPASPPITPASPPIIVTARDEARAIGACLDSLLADAGDATELLVVLDDCTDATAAIVAARGVRSIVSSGGKVAAQRAGVAATPNAAFRIFADADLVVAPGTIAALCAAMADPATRVAVPPKQPFAPRRRSPLARALHRYNAERPRAAHPTWFSGKLFAIRAWHVPDATEVARRARALPASRFYAFAAPLRVDDVYLSRATRGIHETADGMIRFRAPETLRGMYRYYRRMRRELERIDALFPELPATRDPPGRDRGPLVFRVALAACRVAYRAERFAVDRLHVAPGDPWPAISETK
ncbi:MAG: glycosyltransferase [Proteobacteria bacterium]|nr:glycosyltransferase [Pseudomonadota bacterium]